MGVNDKLITKHFKINETDNEKLQAIKESIGLVTDSQAIRVALRSYKVKA